ncbi:ParA/MinD ATPase like-domain-containing protein [Mrakia frigida]|uniref:ParA/MinD ATPase like-domain-containing protein n=1 Tax=Mrakia frigida TaxID=29902 RepID=UPI003FCC1538
MTHLHPLSSRLSSVIITTPQAVSLLDTSKSLSFTRKVGLPVLGLIENMSGYACPCCGDITYLFGQGGGEEMCRREGLQFLGRVPVESDLVGLLDATSRRPPPPPQRILENGEVEVMEVKEEEELVIPEGSFDLSERYKKTLSSKLFEPMAAEVVRLLKARTEEEFAEAAAAAATAAITA